MPPENFQEDDYRVLGLKPDAKPAEVKRAYRALAKQCHPDRFHSMPYETRALAEEKFRRLHEAYERISSRWGKHPGLGRTIPSAPAPEAPPKTPSDWLWQERFNSIDRKMRFSFAGRILFFGAIICVLLIQAGAFFFDTSQENVDTSSPLIVAEPGPATRPIPRPPEPEPEPEKLLSSNEPAPEPADPLLQFPPDPSMSYFTIGSPGSDVLRIQGNPSRIQGRSWAYGLSEVHFRNGMVWSYNNFDGNLRVRLLPRLAGDGTAPSHFTVGSTEDDILRIQGTPTRVEQDRWFYGFAEIKFKDGRVTEFNNYFGNLKVRLHPSRLSGPGAQKPYFTIGSPPDDVIAVQGTPTSIQTNVWAYNFSYVFFRDGKVSSVTNSDNNLHFRSPEDTRNTSAENQGSGSGS